MPLSTEVKSVSNISIGKPATAANLGVKSNPTQNKIAGMVVLLIACIAAYWFLVLPKSKVVAVKKTQYKTLYDQEQAASQQAMELTALVNQLKSNPEQVAELDKALPLDGKTFDLQLQLQNFAAETGVTVGQINFSGPANQIWAGNTALLKDPYAPTRTLGKLTGSIAISGNFTQLQNFLQRVEGSIRILDVSGLSIASGDNNNLDLQLSVTAYYFSADQ